METSIVIYGSSPSLQIRHENFIMCLNKGHYGTVKRVSDCPDNCRQLQTIVNMSVLVGSVSERKNGCLSVNCRKIQYSVAQYTTLHCSTVVLQCSAMLICWARCRAAKSESTFTGSQRMPKYREAFTKKYLYLRTVVTINIKLFGPCSL